MALLLSEAASDCGETPVLVRLVEFGRLDAMLMQACTELRQLMLITGSQVDVRGVVVGRATVEVSVFDASMGGLNGLLHEWDVAARDGVQVRLGNLQHDALSVG